MWRARRIAGETFSLRTKASAKGGQRPGNLVFASILLFPILLGSVSCGRTKVQAQSGGFPPPLVSVVNAKVQDVPRYLDEIGRNAAFESVNLMPQVSGRVTERRFQDGEDLKKGQLLFVIDPSPLKAQLDSAKASLAQAQAALELAKVQFARDRELVGTRAISKQDYDTKKSTVDQSEAQVEAANAAIETAQINLDYCYIHSPIDGRAGARLIDVGNVVQANTTTLLSIQRIDPIYALFTVTENDLPSVQKQMGHSTLKALVRLPSDPEDVARAGKVEFLDNSVQNSTGTVNLRATLPNLDRHFWPGQFVNVRLVLDTQKGALLLPNEAAQISQKGPFVFVVKADDTAELRPVTLGQREGSDVVITKGLAAGERVVLAGHLLVRPEGKVQIQSASAPAPGPAVSGKPAGSDKRGGS